MDEQQKVKCNWCDKVFTEDKIDVHKDDEEYCLYCTKTGYLMDLED